MFLFQAFSISPIKWIFLAGRHSGETEVSSKRFLSSSEPRAVRTALVLGERKSNRKEPPRQESVSLQSRRAIGSPTSDAKKARLTRIHYRPFRRLHYRGALH